jgi:hypothetical protein
MLAPHTTGHHQCITSSVRTTSLTEQRKERLMRLQQPRSRSVKPSITSRVEQQTIIFLPCQEQVRRSAHALRWRSRNPTQNRICKLVAREPWPLLRPSPLHPPSHTSHCDLSLPLVHFCRCSPPVCECAILAPRSRPFHLTRVHQRTRLSRQRGYVQANLLLAHLHRLDTLRPEIVISGLISPTDPVECAARAERSRPSI